MKGLIFTEFLEMVENHFSLDMVDTLLDECHLASSGIYTAVGTYDHHEMVLLVSALAKHSGSSVSQLLKTFGQYLFTRFHQNYPHFFYHIDDCFTFLAGIEHIIHAEVRKLYPDAQLPRFVTEHHDTTKLILRYDSERHFEDLAEGLILGCIKYFGTNIHLHRETVNQDGSTQERFILNRA